MITPDGARNQIEGGIIQGASFVLKERVRFADGKVAAVGWEDYRFCASPRCRKSMSG